MNGKRARLRLAWMLLAAVLAIPSAAMATNGMYLAGYGTEANGRGGTDIAIADRALGLQSNPAGIAQLMGNHFTVDLQILMPDLDYGGDFFGNNLEGENNQFFMPTFSYVRGGKETKWTWGIGMVSQGGMGAEFRGYNTPFGTTDNSFSEVRFATLTPAVAYSITPDLSVGLTAKLGYSDVAFKFWPNTSSAGGPGNPFFGADMEDPAAAFNYAFRLGLMWRATPKWQFGFVYQNKTEGDYENGTLVLDQSSIGLGKVSYDATVDNFTWPEELGFGVQFRPTPKWMIALDVKEYKWSDAITLIEVTGTNPSDANAPPEVVMPFNFQWKDQTVAMLGLEYRLGETYTFRGGFNHGASPVPDETLNPLFPATLEDHLTFGLGYNWGAGNTFNFAIERAFEATQTNSNTNPQLDPFAGSTISHSQWTVSLGYSKAFARKKK